MKVTYYGHSSFGVETAGKHLLFDPFITPNPLASDIKINTIKADYILLSHAHQDHVADVPFIAQNTGATIVSCYEVCMHFAEEGINTIRPMNTGGSFSADGLTVKAVHAIHSSSFADGSYGGVPFGFIVTSKEGSFYFAGDTALHYDMKLTGESHQLKFAMLPVGDNFTMGAADAIKAADFIKCSNIIGMHYNTFELIKINTEDVSKQFEKAGKRISFLGIGEAREF